MNREPVFLRREQTDTIHRDQIDAYGVLTASATKSLGVCYRAAFERHVYGDGDLYEIAAAATYEAEAMVKVASHEMDRTGLARFFPDTLSERILLFEAGVTGSSLIGASTSFRSSKLRTAVN